MDGPETNTTRPDGRPDFRKSFGFLQLGAALGTIFFMAHHPTSFSDMSGIAGMVHGMMLLMLLGLATGFIHFAQTLGLQHMLVLSGLVTYLASAFGNGLAGVINGFVVPSLAAREEDVIGHDIFDLAWDMNQSLAELAVIGTGVAYALWSVHLLRQTPRQPWLAGLGLVAGVAPAAALLGGDLGMHVHTAMIIYSTQVLWAGCVGVTMIRGGR